MKATSSRIGRVDRARFRLAPRAGWRIGALWFVLGAVIFGPGAAEETAAAIWRQSIPPVVDKWLPSDWWVPERSVSGHINADPHEDLAIVVARRVDAPEDPDFPRGSRGLLVLFGDDDGRWRRGAMLPGLLPCVECTGALGGRIGSALFDIEVSADGLLEVGWVARKQFTKGVRLWIGWDSGERGLGLLADEVSIIRPGHRGLIHRDYRAGRMWVDGAEIEMPARFIPIEDVSAEQY